MKESLPILVNEGGIVISLRRVQPSKQESSKTFTVDGIMTFSRAEQPLNKLNLMIVINGVRMMLLSEVHLEKVKPLIVATESGMSTLTKELHFENAHESNRTTEEGIDTSTSSNFSQ